MELNKALPVARVAMRQMIILKPSETNAAAGCRMLQQTSRGRQERVSSGDDTAGRIDHRTMTDALKDKAKQVTETVKDKAHSFTESIKEKTGIGAQQTSTRDPQKDSMDQIYKEQGVDYEKKYEDATGTNRMGEEGNLWEANQHHASGDAAKKPGFSTLGKVGEAIKGAKETVTEKVTEGARKLGLKK